MGRRVGNLAWVGGRNDCMQGRWSTGNFSLPGKVECLVEKGKTGKGPEPTYSCPRLFYVNTLS